MERADIDLLVVLDETRSLSAAAKVLHTAQPALSRRLARIERRVGARLFERGRNGAVATPAGRAVVVAARSARASIEEVEAVGRRAAAGSIGVLRIGTTPTLGADCLPGVLAEFRAARPNVRLELASSGDSAWLRSQVADRELDLALAVLPATLEARTELATEGQQTFVLVVPADDPLAGSEAVAREELIGRQFVALNRGEGLRAMVDDLLEDLRGEMGGAVRGDLCAGRGVRAGVAGAGVEADPARPSIALETTEREMLVPFVAAGLGSTLVPEHFARTRTGPGTAVVRLDPALIRRVGVIVSAGERQPIVDEFVSLIRI